MSQARAITIKRFSEDALWDALSNEYFAASTVSSMRQAQHLYKHLSDVGAKTIIIEHDYTDGDYVDDFASYYVKCFENYRIECKRLHFFSLSRSSFTYEKFTQMACGETHKELLEKVKFSYLGFIVARPLPQAIIGRTVLKPCDNSPTTDFYTALLKYEANLLGIPLEIKSLAFQEQDTVVAACATVALWTSFHKSADLFGTQTPRPAAITVSGNKVISDSRSIPSRGLIIEQMCAAISEHGLEPELISVYKGKTRQDLPIRSLLYGYLKMGLAPIVVMDLPDLGLHAVTLAGYSIQPDRLSGFAVGGRREAVPMIGARINAFFGHDDQVGPFAEHKVVVSTRKDLHPVALSGTWPDGSGGYMEMYPLQIIVPVYNKIRVSFTDVQKWLVRLNDLFKILLDEFNHEWDLYLVTTNDYKAELQSASYIDDSVRRDLIMRQHPRFLWRAILRAKGVPLFEMLFDATDIPESFTGYCIAWHFEPFREAIRDKCEDESLQDELRFLFTDKLYEFLREASSRMIYTYKSKT